MKNILILIALLSVATVTHAQNVAGNWKLVACYAEMHSGAKQDYLKPMIKDKPCLAKVSFVFSSSGKIGFEKNNCDVESEKPVIGVKWTVKGNKLSISMEEDDDDPQVFNLEFKGNKMIWKVPYERQKSIAAHQDVKLLVYEFEKG